MDIEAALFSLLTADETVSALIGTRIFPLVIPDKETRPCVVRVLMGRATIKIYEEPGRTSLCESHIRLISISKGRATYDTAKAIDQAVRQALEGYQGDFGTEPNTVSISGAFLADCREYYVDDTETVEIASDYMISHTQPIRSS